MVIYRVLGVPLEVVQIPLVALVSECQKSDHCSRAGHVVFAEESW